MLLVGRPYFKGAGFSAGDRYISDVAKGAKQNLETARTGNPEKWLQAGINHHMTLASRQVSGGL